MSVKNYQIKELLRSLRRNECAVKRKKHLFSLYSNAFTLSMIRGAKIRKHKFSKLIKRGNTLQHIVLTSSKESPNTLNRSFDSLVKRIRRHRRFFEYVYMRTDEGVCGVLHIVAFTDRFITKQWLSGNWSDIFQATVTWSTQCYGNIRSIINYLLGYLKHHSFYRVAYSKNILFRNWRNHFKFYLKCVGYSAESLRVWTCILEYKREREILACLSYYNLP